MQLIAEGFGGTKAAVDGLYSYWVDGETVRVNGVDKTVTVSSDDSSAYITDVDAADVYRALYPESLNGTADLSSDVVSVQIPHSYTYRESGGRQQLGVPMAAYGTSSSRLWFQHLTAALTVEIKNTYGFTIEVDSVVVASNQYQLSGEKTVTLADAINVGANDIGVDDADRRVAVTFDGGTSLQLLAGETRRVQVPVLPVGDNNRFTITVGVHKVDDANVHSTFCRTQSGGQNSYALARRQMGYAGVSFGGVFTVDNTGKQVIIAQGNLQYVPATGVWSFHNHQYDICEVGLVDSTTRYIAGGTEPIDLFGFGTSGYNGMVPYMTSKTATDYTAPASSIAQTDYDWGWYNAIANGGNAVHQWYSLTSGQWTYLFKTRTTSTSGINNNDTTRYAYATIGGSHKGVILFPDIYVHPSDVDLTSATFNKFSNFTAAVSYADWYKMEAAGAVFLPAAGYRWSSDKYPGNFNIVAGYGMYWTGDAPTTNTNNAFRIRFWGSISISFSSEDRSYGMSVRVVKDLQ